VVGRSWFDGWRRVFSARAVIAGVFAATLLTALPLALTMRGLIEAHLGRSAMADRAADGVNYDWWQEFSSQATGLGATFTPSVIGFAATLDNLSGLLDGQRETLLVGAALATYLIVWTFLTGGILDRYARQRPVRAHGFFAACGVFFWRFLRLGVAAGLVYWFLFTSVHGWLFDDLHARMTRDLAVEREAFAWRAGLYAVFAGLLAATVVVFDYARIRTVVEDRRSAIGSLLAALAFIGRNPGRVAALYALNALTFFAVLAVWAFAAPGAGGAGAGMWLAFAGSQLYVLARLAVKLQFLASQTSLFQARLAHAVYTAAPAPVWPDSPAAEAIVHAEV
jgi:hypothetical protein